MVAKDNKDDESGSTVGLSAVAHDRLRRLKEDGYFNEMLDAYRFAIALAISNGGKVLPVSNRQTIFNVGTLDPDGNFGRLVALLIDHAGDEPIHKTLERLAEWGITELGRRIDRSDISFAQLLIGA